MKKQNYESFAASLDADAGLGLNVKTGEALACGAVGVHPLAKFVDFDGKAKPPRWVIPGFVGHGVQWLQVLREWVKLPQYCRLQ